MTTLMAERPVCHTTAKAAQCRVHPACSACGDARLRPAGFKRASHLLQCERCGTVQVWPQPTTAELQRLYSGASGYFATALRDLSKAPSMGAHSIHNRLTAVGVRGRRFLDVGCGNGQLIYHLRELGWNVWGLDLNAHGVEIARANGLDVQHADLQSCDLPSASFDAINMGDLIEHVPDPLSTLERAWELLAPNGLLLIRTPNAACGFAKASLEVCGRLGMPWPHSEAPFHLHEFTPAGLSTLVHRAGLEVVDVNRHGKTPFWYTLGGFGWFDDLKARMKRTGRYRLDWGLVAHVPKLAVVASLLLPLHAYGLAADRLNGSGRTLTMLARRPGLTGEMEGGR